MVSQKQLEANRHNALKSTGPKTAEGKATVARNALKHGLCAGLRVLPGLEQQEQWEGHVAQTWAAFRPVGYIEEMLAERIALLLWRLGRVARFEREAAATAYEESEREMAKKELVWGSDRSRMESCIEDAARRFRQTQERCDHLERLWELPAEQPIPEGYEVFSQAAQAAGVWESVVEEHYSKVMGGEEMSYRGWTAGKVRQAIEATAKHRGEDPQTLLLRAARDARCKSAEAERELRSLERELDRRRRRLILAPEKDLVNISRYESHLERGLYKALHELERLQAARQGEAVAAPVVVDVDVSGAGSAT